VIGSVLVLACLGVSAVGSQLAPITIEDSVKVALANSPKLRAARMEQQAARAQNGREKPVARPNVTAEVRGTLQGPKVTYPQAGGRIGTVLPEQYGQAALTIDQLIFRPGAGAAGQRYSAMNQAAHWNYLKAENDLILDVRKAYINLVARQALADVALHGVKMASAQLEQTKLMMAAGNAMERDVKASDSDLAEAEQGVLRAENGVGLARANLNRLLGRKPEDAVQIVAVPGALIVPAYTDSGIELALKRRPEIRILEEQLRSARAGAILAGTQDKPSLSAQAIGLSQTPSAFVRSEYFAASLILRWNPFDTGKSHADVGEARARVGQLEAILEDAKLGIRLEVEKALNDMKDAEARIKASERQVAAAEAAADVSRLRFQVRQALQLEVSGALFNVTKARSNRAQAQFDLHLAVAEFAHATGGDVSEAGSK
jgi:outer membrane protein